MRPGGKFYALGFGRKNMSAIKITSSKKFDKEVCVYVCHERHIQCPLCGLLRPDLDSLVVAPREGKGMQLWKEALFEHFVLESRAPQVIFLKCVCVCVCVCVSERERERERERRERERERESQTRAEVQSKEPHLLILIVMLLLLVF
jgi:hypothetical protein